MTEAHGRKWYALDDAALAHFKPTQHRQWYVYNSFGVKVHPGTDAGNQLTRLDAFRIMFPTIQMRHTINLTNEALTKRKKKTTTEGEMLRFFGILILMTRIRCRDRRDLWKSGSEYKYQPSYGFGATGLTRMRWEDIWQSLCFSKQPVERPANMTHADHRWMLVDDFVTHFNSHRATNYFPSEKICVDESMVRWYGLGGDWINLGLPFYIALDRKPEDGCEIQDSCDGQSHIMMRLRIVKKLSEEQRDMHNAQAGDVGHGTMCLLELVRPWLNKRGSRRVTCGDSFFASVDCASIMNKHNMDFIGVVKTSHKMYPKKYFENLALPSGRGHSTCLVAYDGDGNPELMAIMWVDRDRKYFIGTCEGSNPGMPQYRVRWRQVENGDSNADPVRLMMEIKQPRMVESYYSFCGIIDQLNKQRQSDLEMEKYVRTNDWSKRVNLSILSMCMVDAMNLNQQCKHQSSIDKHAHEWFSKLAEEMIDNDLDGVSTRSRSANNTPSPQAQRNDENNHHADADEPPAALTPCKERNSRGHSKQGWCKVCRNKKVTTMCRTCTRNHDYEAPFWVCNTNSDRGCWDTHFHSEHA